MTDLEDPGRMTGHMTGHDQEDLGRKTGQGQDGGSVMGRTEGLAVVQDLGIVRGGLFRL